MVKLISTYVCEFFSFRKNSNLLSINTFQQKVNQSLPEFLPKPGIKGNA